MLFPTLIAVNRSTGCRLRLCFRKKKKKNERKKSARLAAIRARLCLCALYVPLPLRQVHCAVLLSGKYNKKKKSTACAAFSACVHITCVCVCVCLVVGVQPGACYGALWLWLVACLLALQTTKKELSLFSCVSICVCIRACMYVRVRAALANKCCQLALRSANFPST